MLWREPEKSHLARCLIRRWGSMRDSNHGFLVMALRARTLRQEFWETLVLGKVALLKLLCCSLVALSLLFSLALCIRYPLPQYLSQLSGAVLALPRFLVGDFNIKIITSPQIVNPD